jgi:hypothetical protein
LHPEGEVTDPVSRQGYERVYRLLGYMAWCDVKLPAKERELLERYRKLFSLGQVEADALEAQGKGATSLDLGDRVNEIAMLVDTLIDVSLADGQLSLREQWRLLSLAKTLGLPEQSLVARISARVRERGVTLEIEVE